MGVQDFDPRVQQAVNRIQGEGETFAVLNDARALGFRSINMDLIYGLPHQTVESFARTLDKIVAAGPDRLSVFNYAHLPELFKTQRRIDAAALPSPAEKLAILQHTIERLTAAGYVYIGMDHFAKPDDELAVRPAAGGRCIATSRATRRTPTATSSASASPPSAWWGRATARTLKHWMPTTRRSTPAGCRSCAASS